ncbi:MAG TPA: sigma-70 family RNA polymerase sigma factor [Terriglobia bacterium]|nr:sigma-70 family RNA polymerase sigma factor [Terriglobia bacterium]
MLFGIYARKYVQSSGGRFDQRASHAGIRRTLPGELPMVYRTAYGITGRTEDAEDVLQTVFLKLLRRGTPPDLQKNPKGYLYRAAVNLSLTTVQTRRRQVLTDDVESLQSSSHSGVEARDPSAADGKLRRVKITLKNHAGDLSYRESCYANKVFSKFSASDKERQLEEALMLGDPITELPIEMEVNYFQLNHSDYFVPFTIRIPGNELVLAQKVDADRTVIDFIGEIKDKYGTTITNLREKVEIKLKGEAASQLATSPVQYDAGFTLLPDHYVIKVLARNSETGRIGTYQADFTVPNLDKEEFRLPISSVVLSSQRVAMEDALFNAGKDKAAKEQAANPLIEDGKKLIPSVTRVFNRGRDMYVYLQAYERNATDMRPLAVFVSFYRGQEKDFETKPFGVTQGMDLKSKAVPIKLTVPLSGVPAGEYTCQLTVLDSEDKKVAFWQTPVLLVGGNVGTDYSFPHFESAFDHVSKCGNE